MAYLPSVAQRQELSAALVDLREGDILLFTSKNGILAALAELEAVCGSPPAAIKHLKQCAVECWALGVDADVLRARGYENVLTPARASTSGLVEALVARGGIEGRRAVCPVPEVISPLVEPSVVPMFVAGLEAAGAKVARVPAYVTQLGTSAEMCHAEADMLRQGSIEAIVFSSTAEAQGLVHLIGKEAVMEAIKANGIVLAAHGPQTAAGAAAVLGMDVPCVSKDYSSFAGVVAAIEQWFRTG